LFFNERSMSVADMGCERISDGRDLYHF